MKSIRDTGAKAGDFVHTPRGYGHIECFVPGGYTPRWVWVKLADPAPDAKTPLMKFDIDSVRKVKKK